MIQTPALLLALLAGAAAEPPRAETRGPFLDWGTLSRQSVEAEKAQAATVAPAVDPDARAKAATLGERVGQIVAAGDCAEGERQARAAGDVALARAVRDYCYK